MEFTFNKIQNYRLQFFHQGATQFIISRLSRVTPFPDECLIFCMEFYFAKIAKKLLIPLTCFHF